ncbi:transcriptional regulator [Desulfitobacterium dichloroeliminans LMG P-21439]|uniref:Transcriptional regulator n=1 Tax=Desulfitobacterium dichloroeliminans (strain LMG P-21439 / DCA1) TaxID=871963 RepID=L0F719_DESDL|nr:LysR family transcriptional regulator [Desulfitobacterium dichloroeliminans]AGA68446.1 transcriptional regulator [Desulfitobacterium dichloroeliminans LMG P-21439]
MIIEPLEIFRKVAEEKSFSKAADDLFLSQPAVSSHIRNLENEFGTKLINRSSKHVELTPAGEIFYEEATRIINQYKEAKEKINQIQSVVTGTLRIGASFTIGEYILPELISQMATGYPNLNISVTIANTEEIAQGLRQNRLDIALVEGVVNEREFMVEPFMEDEMILIAPAGHPLTKIRSVSAKDLQGFVWILREAGSGTREFSDHFMQALKIKMQHSYVFSSNTGVKAAVISGLGIAMVSKLIIQKELKTKELMTIPLDKSCPYLARDFVIVRGYDTYFTKAAEVFLTELSQFGQDKHESISADAVE